MNISVASNTTQNDADVSSISAFSKLFRDEAGVKDTVVYLCTVFPDSHKRSIVAEAMQIASRTSMLPTENLKHRDSNRRPALCEARALTTSPLKAASSKTSRITYT